MRSIRPISFWWRWVVANALGELIGLGAVATAGYLVVASVGEPKGIAGNLGLALFFVMTGSFEGYVLGYVQAKVLALRVPALAGWVKATTVGAVVAWALGMTPNTIMGFLEPAAQESPPVMSTTLRMLLAAGLGAVTGPLLAFFQWRVLRHYVFGAAWWLPTNALAWVFGMPVIFAGVHVVVGTKGTTPAVLVAASTILLAGAVVGAIHGAVLLWLTRRVTTPEATA